VALKLQYYPVISILTGPKISQPWRKIIEKEKILTAFTENLTICVDNNRNIDTNILNENGL
jgi:hypothetical protein